MKSIRPIATAVLATFIAYGLCSDSDAGDVKVFMMAGQSNMGGGGLADNLPPEWNAPQDDVWIWLDHNIDGVGDWVSLEPGHGNSTHAPFPDDSEGVTPPRDGQLRIGPELSLGRALADAYPDHRIALIKHSYGGRNLESHFHPDNLGPPESPEHMWSGLLRKTGSAFEALDAGGHTYEVEGFFFSLGGGDSRNFAIPFSDDPEEIAAGEAEAIARGEAYGENLTTLITAVRNEFSDSLPFVMPLMIPETTPQLERAYPGFRAVRAGQLDVVANVPSVASFEVEGLTLKDAVHYDAMGQLEFGQRFANAYLDLVTPDLPDFNLDGTVDFDDFLLLSANFNRPGSFEKGDTNHDGFVDFDDFLALSAAFGQSAPSPIAISVPEPVLGCWLGLALLLIVRGVDRPRRRSPST